MAGYFEDRYNAGTQQQVAVTICSFGGVEKGNYVRREPDRRNEMEVRMGKLKNGKAAGKDKVTGETIKKWVS